MRAIIAGTIALLCAAPAGAQELERLLRTDQLPAVGEMTTVAVGKPVLERFNYALLSTAEIGEAISGRVLIYPVEIPAGATLVPVSTKAAYKACHVLTAEEYLDRLFRGCLIDDDGDGSFDRVAVNNVHGATKLPAPVAYTKGSGAFPTATRGFRATTTYLGASKDSLRLRYREFVSWRKRAILSEEYRIPLTASFPQQVVVRDVRIKLHRIDGEGLTYEVEP